MIATVQTSITAQCTCLTLTCSAIEYLAVANTHAVAVARCKFILTLDNNPQTCTHAAAHNQDILACCQNPHYFLLWDVMVRFQLSVPGGNGVHNYGYRPALYPDPHVCSLDRSQASTQILKNRDIQISPRTAESSEQ